VSKLENKNANAIFLYICSRNNTATMNAIIKNITLLSFFLLLLTITGCKRRHNIVQGEWILVNTERTTHKGVQLAPNGLAASINQPTIQYSHWRLHKKHLILSGKRFKSNSIYDFTDTLIIKHLSDKMLIVSTDSSEVRYMKE